MIDVFISYKRERRKVAAHLADVLRLYGYGVWFDYGLVKGADFGFQIDKRIREAKAVVVLWCPRAVQSEWVTAEASLAARLGKLVPVKIEPCELIVEFERKDYTDITAWNTMPRDHVLDALLDTVGDKVGRALNFDLKAVREFEDRWRRSNIRKLADFADETPDPALTEEARLITPSRPGIDGATAAETLLTISAREWPAVRDSRDTARLSRFEAAFAGTYYAGEAAALRGEIESEARARAAEDDAKAAELAKVARYRAEKRIKSKGVIAHGAPDGWFLPGAGKTEWFQDFPGGPEMVVVPEGAFTMGSSDADVAALVKEFGKELEQFFKWETPTREITIPKPFALGRLAVTRGEFAAFVSATGYQADGGAYVWTGKEFKLDPKKSWRDPGFTQDDSHPAVCVNWDDAQAYIDWLNGKASGKPYRLPSEAEWEYACRARTVTPFWWGASISVEQANYDGNFTYGGGLKGEWRQKTMPAQSFDPNPWGLYQVHGNVWEWCSDCWNDSHNEALDTGFARTTGDCTRRVLRGGSWNVSPRILRAAHRDWDNAGDRGTYIGFRVARTL